MLSRAGHAPYVLIFAIANASILWSVRARLTGKAFLYTTEQTMLSKLVVFFIFVINLSFSDR